MLTAEILKKRILETVEVEVPELGGSIRVRLLSYGQITNPKEGQRDAEVLHEILVEPLLSLKDLEAMDLATVQALTAAAMKANGISDDDDEDLEKN